MAATTRIYIVFDKATSDVRLVRATHPSHALQHVARDTFSSRVATQDDLIDALAAGVHIENINAEQQELPE